MSLNHTGRGLGLPLRWEMWSEKEKNKGGREKREGALFILVRKKKCGTGPAWAVGIGAMLLGIGVLIRNPDTFIISANEIATRYLMIGVDGSRGLC